MGTGARFADVFESRRNGLNFVRLALAVMVIFWHSFPLTGTKVMAAPLVQLLGNTWVDGFFAISGYLIVASWMSRPVWTDYLRARVLRIIPGFWMCLLVTAMVIVPLVTGELGSDNLRYVIVNAGLFVNQYGIDGTPLGVPYEGVWNGSLWTLAWEFLCYLAVLVLGLARALRWRYTIPVVFVGCLVAAVAVDLGLTSNYWIEQGSRFGLMFSAGSLIWRFQTRIPVNWYVISTAGVIVIASMLLPNYRLVAAVPLAYLVLALGAVTKSPRLRFRNDISYGVYIYAFVVQQVLAVWGLWTVGPVLFFVLATVGTLPIAAASWFLIERPALRLKRRRPLAPPAAPAPTTAASSAHDA